MLITIITTVAYGVYSIKQNIVNCENQLLAAMFTTQ